MSEEDISATPFNFAMIFYINLNNRLTIKADAYMNNDITGYYKGLKVIYNMIQFVILEGDKKGNKDNTEDWDTTKLDKQFEEAKKNLQDRKAKKDTMIILDKIDKQIMILMNKYHMIFPNIESTQGIDKLYNQYKIPIKK